MKRKLLRLAAALLVLPALVSSTLVYAAGLSGSSFWAVSEVEEALSLGLIPERLLGAEATDKITRADFCALAVRLFKVMHEDTKQTSHSHYTAYFDPANQTALTDPFDDCDDPDVLTAYAIGIVAGTSSTTFEPDAPVTREQICKMFFNILTVEELAWRYTEEFTEVRLCSYTDGYRVSSWARTPVAALACAGVLKGVGGGTIDYLGSATIEQAVLLAVRFYKTFLAGWFNALDGAKIDGRGFVRPSVYPYSSRYETLEQKHFRIFGVKGKSLYSSAAEASADMVKIPLKVWQISSNGEKVTKTLYVTMNKAIAPTIIKIFDEIYNGSEKFPICDVGGYNWGSGKNTHSCGVGIDINVMANPYIKNGVTYVGDVWEPGKNPYSIPENGEVVAIFAKYGFAWGGNAWRSATDYMHFSYFGT